ncbi:MAG TPA: TIGR03943 family protein [Jatrophihabitans sp.]|uniref:TIGR03943 family putative permease subunit n=1 Tax=Jatrophihabitans sp. TaxID=1932789 RepID=UPI002DFF5D3C|nr:TIGR03943 family protein [Jatrophihabitans sp.]
MKPAAGTLTALVGLLTMRLTVDGSFQRYVRTSMRPWLLIAGVALLALGIVAIAIGIRTPAEPADDDDHGIGVGWLLLVPVVALLLVAPPTLGSFGVDRSTAIRVTAGRSSLPPLAPSDQPIPMTLQEYTERSFDHAGASMRNAVISLTGFVANGATATSFRLARYQISCCAADAAAAVVKVIGFSGSAPPRDQWLTVTGRVSSVEGEDPVLRATTVRDISAPEDPYE